MPNKSFTQLPEFLALQAHQKHLQQTHMRQLFVNDQQRAERYRLDAAGLYLDYSKHKITDETLDLLRNLANACDLYAKRTQLFSGAALNDTEHRAVLHPALRGSVDPGLEIGGENIQGFVNETLARIAALSHQIRQSHDITDVVHIGIGGSDLGPRLVCHALRSLADGPRVHFAANMDAADLESSLQHLLPQHTLFIIASKTFTTLETISNAHLAFAWASEALGEQRAREQFFAVTMNTQAAQNFGISEAHILPLRDWIGGRYSLWSAIGLTIAVAIDHGRFLSLLAGARDMDTHFQNADLANNMPVIMALLSVWYRNFFDYRAHAILPYAHDLSDLPAYVQQLEMESNGKAADWPTSPVIFGASGTNGQHAFFQCLHQGTDIIPCDFIAAAMPGHESDARAHQKLLANALAQAQALMQGQENKTQPHRNFSGDRPSSMLLLKRLDPYHLGALLALYEHKTFVQGVLWGINSFDQWGVELGKTLATDIIHHFEAGADLPATVDSSTKALIKRLKS